MRLRPTHAGISQHRLTSIDHHVTNLRHVASARGSSDPTPSGARPSGRTRGSHGGASILSARHCKLEAMFAGLGAGSRQGCRERGGRGQGGGTGTGNREHGGRVREGGQGGWGDTGRGDREGDRKGGGQAVLCVVLLTQTGPSAMILKEKGVSGLLLKTPVTCQS